MTILQLTHGQPVRTTGNNLVGVWRPSFVKVDQRLFVFGGGGNATNDMHILNLCDMRWETAQKPHGNAPNKRYGHTATLWNNCIVVFGGCNEHQEYCNDVHVYNIEKMTWYQPYIIGTIPARYLHSAVVFDNKLFVYGGFSKNSECTFVLNDFSTLDLLTMTWTTHHGFPARYAHSATLIGHKAYIYAGKGAQGDIVSELVAIDLTSPPYTPQPVLNVLQSHVNSPMVMFKSPYFCEAVHRRLLVFGRCSSNDVQSNQYGLWMLNLDTLEWHQHDSSNHFEGGAWNYFTVISENSRPEEHPNDSSEAIERSLFFLGNTDLVRPQGHDHYRYVADQTLACARNPRIQRG